MFKHLPRICVFALAAVALHAQTTTPPATPPPQTTRTSAMAGIAEGQTGQLNVLNPGVMPPATGVVCSGLLSILDGQGNVLKTKTVSVNPGASQSLSVDSDRDLLLAVDERKQIRATVTVPPVLPPPGSTTPQTAPCRLIGNLEIFDTLSGRSQVILGVVHEVPSAVATPAVP